MKTKQFISRRIAKFLAVLLAVSTVFVAPLLSAHAEDAANPYVETHEQINFDDLNVTVVGKKKLVVEPDESTSLIRRWKAKGEKAKLNKYLEEHEYATEDILEMVLENDGQLYAIAYTEAPVEQDEDGNIVRMRKQDKSDLAFTINANAATSATGTKSPKGNFTIQISIKRSGSAKPYTYTSTTKGVWTGLSTLGGENGQDATQEDHIFLAHPSNITSTSLAGKFTWSGVTTNGNLGADFWKHYDEGRYVEYKIRDKKLDLLNYRYLNEFTLTGVHKANPWTSGEYKKISAYYVHTYKKVGVESSINVSGTKKDIATSVNITIKKEKCAWQVACSVSYNF